MLIPLTSTFKMVKIAEILLWRIPWTEEPGRLLFMGCKSWTRCSAILISYRYLTTIKSIYIAFELASARIQTVMWTLALNEPQAADSTSNLRHLMLTPPRWNLTFDSWPLIWTLTWKLEQNLRLRLKSDANPHQEVKPWNWAGDFDLQIPGLWFAPWSQTVHVDLNLSPDANGSWIWIFEFSSVQFSCSVLSNALWPHELQHARPPCPSPTLRVHSDSRPSSQWCHPAISSSVVPFSSCPQSLPESESGYGKGVWLSS